MKLRPVLSASAVGVLIAAASAVPSLASEEETPREREVSVTPVAPSPEAKDEPTSNPPENSESPSEEGTAEVVDEEEDDTEDPSSIEDLLEETAEPVRPSVEAPEPPAVPAEAPTRLEALNSPFVAADNGSNVANNDRAVTEANTPNGAARSQNPGPAPREVSNSPFANSPAAQAESDNSENAPEGIVFGPQNLPIVPAEDGPFVGADALAQVLLNAQNPIDNEPVEETTDGTSEAPGRVESRRIVRPDQPAAAAPQENITNPQTSPSNPEDSRSDSLQDTHSAPPNNLVTTGAASALLAIGGVLMIAGGAGILFWHRRSTSK
ncbi:hypothetical protein [Enteractinococcus helveticum]|uniref:Gram-positive cocci surface proteins LPxTG domain-containing protein n=1 Tax=Enteractinococcus helveticum TaxID=1837282 RepID=A0A1B7M0N1_9MICC|nr:hypothetical protein [Enteractinococcus helveticum]OAV61784.1 hypothetical protein A6F49_07775 [Enteractinococcus helveticum]